MDELERAAELINGALEALSLAAVGNPELREDFARRCERLRLLMDEVEAARERMYRSERSIPSEACDDSTRSDRAGRPVGVRRQGR
jgi:hypothetical protein